MSQNSWVPISQIARKLDIPDTHLNLLGEYKAKVSLTWANQLPARKKSHLILVTAITPTPAGEGKTTTTVGLGDALNLLGKRTAICLREPSLGPVFGMKGGATGGGRAQVGPTEDINLHFTGDFSAIQLAHNLLAALIDNHIHHGNELGFDPRRITWKRVIDMNDRALRQICIGLGGIANGFPREDGFDIVVASEIMSIFCLATGLTDLKQRLSKIVIGYTRDRKEIRVRDLNAQGALTLLLKDAIHPNLVQTLENTPAFIHGGPFANIAHGCNSVLATQTALKLADYVVTEAGFGADLGAEKFVDIKCRKSGIRPSAAVVVATLRALKFHGGVDAHSLQVPNRDALQNGLVNLEHHVRTIQDHYGLDCVVAINHFDSDPPEETELILNRMKEKKIPAVLARHWAEGGKGARELAEAVLEAIENPTRIFKFVYDDATPLLQKIRQVAQSVYGATDIKVDGKIREQLQRLEENGYGHFPICIAKTPYAFSTDPARRGIPHEHVLPVREIRLAAGAEFIVILCGDVMTMPGLPKIPAALKMDIDEDGKITGLC